MKLRIATRSSEGAFLYNIENEKFVKLIGDNSTSVRCITFDGSGKYFAYANGATVNIIETNTNKEMWSYSKPRCSKILFSPLSNVIVLFELFQVPKESKENYHNVQLLNIKNGEVIVEFISRNTERWAPQWSTDEEVCAWLQSSSDVSIYLKNDFARPNHHFKLKNCRYIELAPFPLSNEPRGHQTYLMATFTPGIKSDPNMIRVYSSDSSESSNEPLFNGNVSPIAAKTFYKADSCLLHWNCLGQALLILATVDQSDESYYGKQQLYFLNCYGTARGDSIIVPLVERGPIYHIEWQPVFGKVFVVTHGFMPAVTVVYNMKCEPVHNFGKCPRNICYFNRTGNLLAICGFGSLRGGIDVYDFEKKKKISEIESLGTTYFEWAPDGRHFLTATTAPRLMVNNGVRLWTYKGHVVDRMEYEGTKIQLVDAIVQPLPTPTTGKNVDEPLDYKTWNGRLIQLKDQKADSVLDNNKGSDESPLKRQVDNNSTISVLKRETEKNKYVPPHMKHQLVFTESNVDKSKVDFGKYDFKNFNLDALSDLDCTKRCKNILKKLQDIEKLQARVQKGENLEKTQIEKINNESKLVSDLDQLLL